MEEPFTFSVLKIQRLNEAISLIRDVFLTYEAPEYADEGVQGFMRFIEPERMKGK